MHQSKQVPISKAILKAFEERLGQAFLDRLKKLKPQPKNSKFEQITQGFAKIKKQQIDLTHIKGGNNGKYTLMVIIGRN